MPPADLRPDRPSLDKGRVGAPCGRRGEVPPCYHPALLHGGGPVTDPTAIGARIDEWFAFTRDGSHPGAAVLVVRDGTPLHRRGYGLADLEARTPITPDTAFYLCSLSKAFTAMAIMLLAVAGRLGYDDALPRFFPELPAFARPITVRCLLHHTSGLPDYFQLSQRRDLAELAGFTDEDVLAWLCRLATPDFRPGERRQYSNAGYVLLAMLVARAADQPFHRFLHERIFAPLGMARTLRRARRTRRRTARPLGCQRASRAGRDDRNVPRPLALQRPAVCCAQAQMRAQAPASAAGDNRSRRRVGP